MTTTQPRYARSCDVARHCGVSNQAINMWRRRYPPEHTLCPTPAPDAWIAAGGDDIPLWLEHRLPAWDAWRKHRDKVVAQWRRSLAEAKP